jgi:undecaprenyl diphosphate synthase
LTFSRAVNMESPKPESMTSTQEASRPVPQHVAVIMDGNGRWATSRGLPRLSGHEAGTENIRRITTAAGEIGVRYLTLWAFSTENWRRPRDEVEGILQILSHAIVHETEALHQRGAQLRHIGSLEGLSPELQNSIRGAIELTRNNETIVLTLAFNYGGRAELVHAVRRIIEDGIPSEHITEDLISQYLYTDDIPDPDLVIRTSGEFRTSNFLIWQAAYAEWHFTPVLWPDFGPDHLKQAVEDYTHRERRFGGIGHRTSASDIG